MSALILAVSGLACFAIGYRGTRTSRQDFNGSAGHFLCSNHTGYSYKNSKVYYIENWYNNICKTITKPLYCNWFCFISTLDFDDVECTKPKHRRIHPGRMGFVAYLWCKQSDAGCFDTHGFEPLFFS